MAAFLLVASSSMYAQINKGNWLVGGNVGFESGKTGDFDESKYTTFTIAPNAGYFFIDQLAAGLRLDVTSTKYKEADDPSSSFALAPFVRYYFLDPAQKVNIFGDASFGFGSEKEDGESASINEYSIMAGPAIFLSPNTALEFGLYYKSRGGEAYKFGDDQERWNRFGLQIGFQIHLGGK